MTDRESFEQLASEKYGDKFDSLTDEAVESLFEKFEEKFDTFGDEKLALTAAVGSFNFDQNMEGSSESVDIIAVGSNGPRPFGEEDALFCYGIAIPDSGKVGRCVVLVNESDVSEPLADLTDYFVPYESIEADVNIREASKVTGIHEGSSAYIAEVGRSNDPFSLRDSDRSKDEREELVRDHVEEASIAEISEYFSLRDNGYTANFGLDFKRIDAAVVLNARISAKGARYVFQDDSFLDAEELSPEVRGEDNDIGLVSWCEPHQATFDEESVVDVFGTITPNDDGHVTMRMFGATETMEGSIVPAEAPSGESEDSSSSQQSSTSGSSGTSSEPVEERTI